MESKRFIEFSKLALVKAFDMNLSNEEFDKIRTEITDYIDIINKDIYNLKDKAEDFKIKKDYYEIVRIEQDLVAEAEYTQEECFFRGCSHKESKDKIEYKKGEYLDMAGKYVIKHKKREGYIEIFSSYYRSFDLGWGDRYSSSSSTKILPEKYVKHKEIPLIIQDIEETVKRAREMDLDIIMAIVKDEFKKILYEINMLRPVEIGEQVLIIKIRNAKKVAEILSSSDLLQGHLIHTYGFTKISEFIVIEKENWISRVNLARKVRYAGGKTIYERIGTYWFIDQKDYYIQLGSTGHFAKDVDIDEVKEYYRVEVSPYKIDPRKPFTEEVDGVSHDNRYLPYIGFEGTVEEKRKYKYFDGNVDLYMINHKLFMVQKYSAVFEYLKTGMVHYNKHEYVRKLINFLNALEEETMYRDKKKVMKYHLDLYNDMKRVAKIFDNE